VLTAARTEKERGGPGSTKELDRSFDVRDIHHPPRAQLEMVERFMIGPKRAIVIYAGRKVNKVCGWDFVARHRLELEDVEDAVRARCRG
jgi:hypothetical protein